MKSNFIHVCFIIDQSSSMWTSINDVKGGFTKVIEDQKETLKKVDGSCAVSLYTFGSTVEKHFIGKDISEVSPKLDYTPYGMTAMNDGIGTAIDEIGKWLSDMPENERPEKNLIVIITDGEENYSKEYSFDKVKKSIKHQEEKYNWTFMYLGTDITNTKDVDKLGIKTRGYSVRSKMGNSYDVISSVTSSYLNTRGDASVKSAALDRSAAATMDWLNAEYLADTGVDLSNKTAK